MYHVPRMMVPVRTWQQPQHLVVYSLSRLGLKWCMSSTSVGRNIGRAGRGGEKSSQHQQSANGHGGTPTTSLSSCATPRIKTNALTGRKRRGPDDFVWQVFEPMAVKTFQVQPIGFRPCWSKPNEKVVGQKNCPLTAFKSLRAADLHVHNGAISLW